MKITPVENEQKRLKKILNGRNIVDVVKSRSTVVGLVQPAGIAVSLLSTPAETFRQVSQIADAVFHGKMGATKASLTDFVNRIFHPTGIGGAIFKSGVSIGIVSTSIVSGVEIFHGMKNHDKYLLAMGGMDLLGTASSVLFLMGNPIASLGVAVLASVTKTALVFARPKEYSVIQKANSVFDLLGTASSSLLFAKVAILPAFVLNGLVGVTQMLYMNNGKIRNKVNRLIGKIAGKGKQLRDAKAHA